MLPNFQPQWNARRGVEQLYAAYRQQRLQVEEFEGIKYRRVDHIKMLMRDGYLDQTLYWRVPMPA